MISIIVAASENDVIGRQGELPWRLSDDLKHFKGITMVNVLKPSKAGETVFALPEGAQVVTVTGDMRQDMQDIHAFYAEIEGKYPEKKRLASLEYRA